MDNLEYCGSILPGTVTLCTGSISIVPGAWASINKVDVEGSSLRAMEFVFQSNDSNYYLSRAPVTAWAGATPRESAREKMLNTSRDKNATINTCGTAVGRGEKSPPRESGSE